MKRSKQKRAKSAKPMPAEGPDLGRGGWLRLHRKLKESARYKQPGFVQLWVHFLLSASFRQQAALFDGRRVVLQPGQFISSRREIAEATGLNAAKVLRLISDLQSDQQIDQRTGRKHSMFTVLNWGSYQKVDPLNDPPSDPSLIHDRSMTDPSLIHETQNPQAGVQKNDPKKVRSKEGKKVRRRSNVPRSNSGGLGEVQEGDASSAQGVTDAGVLFVVPRFEPVPKGVFRRELENDVVLARRFIAEVKAREDAWVWGERERKDWADDVAWLRAEIAKEVEPVRWEKLNREVEAMEANRMERFKAKLKSEAKAVCEAWAARIKELELAMAGARV